MVNPRDGAEVAEVVEVGVGVGAFVGAGVNGLTGVTIRERSGRGDRVARFPSLPLPSPPSCSLPSLSWPDWPPSSPP